MLHTPVGSRPHTPRGSRPGTPSRLQRNPADEYVKVRTLPMFVSAISIFEFHVREQLAYMSLPLCVLVCPQNLGLSDPSTQSRTNDLLGVSGTEPIDDPPTEAEQARVAALAEKLNKKKNE
ncbi:hypothetical protein P7C70_g7054, partial [Phenoliferia sp. Uapishka_3]